MRQVETIKSSQKGEVGSRRIIRLTISHLHSNIMALRVSFFRNSPLFPGFKSECGFLRPYLRPYYCINLSGHESALSKVVHE